MSVDTDARCMMGSITSRRCWATNSLNSGRDG